MSGHYHPDLEAEAVKCSSCGTDETHRVPTTVYRWCCNCGSIHIDRQEGMARGTTLPAAATLALAALEAMDQSGPEQATWKSFDGPRSEPSYERAVCAGYECWVVKHPAEPPKEYEWQLGFPPNPSAASLLHSGYAEDRESARRLVLRAAHGRRLVDDAEGRLQDRSEPKVRS